MQHRVGQVVLAVVLAALVAAGCASSAPSPAPSAADEPLRILSLTPNITEILFAMGLGDKIVGRSNFCGYPPEALAIPSVGDTLQMNQEKVIALHPTLAFVITRRGDVIRTLESLKIRTVPLNSDRMDELLASIRIIGRETGRPDAAEALVARIQGELAAVREHVRGLGRPKTLFAFPMTIGSAQMTVAGRGTFVDQLLDVAGAENAFPDVANWPQISPQRVIAIGPEIVIVNAVGDEAAADRQEAIRRAWANWTSVPAVAHGRVVILTEACLTIPGPRVGLAARRLADAIHPPAAADTSPPAAPPPAKPGEAAR